MKILLLFSNLLVGICSAFGQNYVGLSQTKIIRNFGDPDEKGNDFFIYYDNDEHGVNTYYFDENKTCKAFVILRGLNYLDDYQKMLSSDFTKVSDNNYVYKSKHKNFKAEITRLGDKFELRITPIEEHIISCVPTKEALRN